MSACFKCPLVNTSHSNDTYYCFFFWQGVSWVNQSIYLFYLAYYQNFFYQSYNESNVLITFYQKIYEFIISNF